MPNIIFEVINDPHTGEKLFSVSSKEERELPPYTMLLSNDYFYDNEKVRYAWEVSCDGLILQPSAAVKWYRIS